MYQATFALPEIWDKMAEIMQIIIHYGDHTQNKIYRSE